MNIHKLFPSQWLSPADLGNRQFELTIESVAMATVRNTQNNQDEQKPAIKFAKAQKRLLMNKTQAFAIAAITGEEDTDRWTGHAVVLSAGIARNRKQTIVITAPASKPPIAEIPADDEEGEEEEETTEVQPVTRFQFVDLSSEMTSAQFQAYLDRYDWTYSYSDDQKVFDRGQAAERKLLSFVRSSSQLHKDLYLAKHKLIFGEMNPAYVPPSI